jgi:hypothetical protein
MVFNTGLNPSLTQDWKGIYGRKHGKLIVLKLSADSKRS